MKRNIWIKILIAFVCVYALGLLVGETEDDEPEVSSVEETTIPTETTVVTEPKETTDAERVGVTEKELHHILNAIDDLNYVDGTDYDVDDIDLIRKDRDTLVEFEEYIVFMKDGEVVRMNINKALLEE